MRLTAAAPLSLLPTFFFILIFFFFVPLFERRWLPSRASGALGVSFPFPFSWRCLYTCDALIAAAVSAAINPRPHR